MLSELLQPFTVGLGAWPVASMIIFLAVFIAALWHMLHMDRKYCEEMSAMPLDTDHAVNSERED